MYVQWKVMKHFHPVSLGELGNHAPNSPKMSGSTFEVYTGTGRAHAQSRNMAQPGLEPESSSAFPLSGTRDKTKAA